MKQQLMVALLLVGASACASGRWRVPELVALGVAEGAVAADCGTTLVALRDPLIVETNPLLGRRPSVEGVALACAAAGTAVWFVGDRSRGTVRWLWLGAIVGLGAVNAAHNLSVRNSPGRTVSPASLTARLTF